MDGCPDCQKMQAHINRLASFITTMQALVSICERAMNADDSTERDRLVTEMELIAWESRHGL